MFGEKRSNVENIFQERDTGKVIKIPNNELEIAVDSWHAPMKQDETRGKEKSKKAG